MERYYEFGNNIPSAPFVDLDCYDASHCGYTDFYPAVEKQLKLLLKSGNDFDTGWMSSSRLLKSGDSLYVFAEASMDEDMDLIDDAIWAVTRKENTEIDISDDMMEEMSDSVWDCPTQAIYYEVIPATSSWDEILSTLSEVGDKCNSDLDDSFNEVKDIVKGILEFNNIICVENN